MLPLATHGGHEMTCDHGVSGTPRLDRFLVYQNSCLSWTEEAVS